MTATKDVITIKQNLEAHNALFDTIGKTEGWYRPV